MGTVLPGGFTVLNNKLYILGGFNTITTEGMQPTRSGSLTPSPAAVGAEEDAVLPRSARSTCPTTTIGNLIYTGGGSDITAGALTDTKTPLA